MEFPPPDHHDRISRTCSLFARFRCTGLLPSCPQQSFRPAPHKNLPRTKIHSPAAPGSYKKGTLPGVFLFGKDGPFRPAGMRAQILDKRKGPERDLAPGPCLVPLTGVEPVRYHYLGILSPVCLPISPQRLIQVPNKILYITTVIKSRNARVQPFSQHKKGDGINPSPLFYFSIVRSDRYQNYSYSLASLVRCSYLSSAILAARSNSLSALSGKERFSEL